MNKRIVFKHKVSKLYIDDIWGIFYRKQVIRNYILRKLGWLFFLENLKIKNKKFLYLRRRRGFLNSFNNSFEFKFKSFRFILWKNYFLKIKLKNKIYNLKKVIYSSFFNNNITPTELNYKNIDLFSFSETEFFLFVFLRRNVISFFKRYRRKRVIKYVKWYQLRLNDITFNNKFNYRKVHKFKSFYHTRKIKAWKLRKFYGDLTHKELKTLCNKVFTKRGDILLQFIISLETRIDTLLYRSNLVISMSEARQWISHNKVLVNNKIVNKRSYCLSNTDVLSIKPNWVTKNIDLMHYRIQNKIVTVNPPVYLEINYKTFMVLFLYDIIKINEVFFNFRFTEKDLNNVLYYYY